MREANQLSPHRVPQKPPCENQGEITTEAPNLIRGTDGAKAFALKEV